MFSLTSYSTRARLVKLFALTMLLAVAFASCKVTEPDAGPSGKIEIGQESLVQSQTIGTGGGRIELGASAGELNGLTIVVQPNTYSGPRTFTISTSPITKMDRGDSFHPLTPIISIANGGEFSTLPMLLTIPVKIPAGHFAMAFAYDEHDNTMEALPLVATDSGSVTIMTHHFDHSGIREDVDESAPGKGGVTMSHAHKCEVVVTSMPAATLLAANVPSGFEPGKDDWQFVNLGSIIAPEGHCAGQSLGMIYYYISQKEHGEPRLTHHFDNNGLFETRSIWPDDAAAYKFCSVLQLEQRDIEVGDVPETIEELIAMDEKAPLTDLDVFKSIKMALLTCKQPQLISIYSAPDAKGKTVGHAMVIYDADAAGLKICDPNYPGNTSRRIEFDGTHFKGYNSALRAGDPGLNFPTVRSMGLTSAFDWRSTTKHWKEFNNRVIGNGLFPAVVINGRDSETAQFNTLAQGWKTVTGKVQFSLDYVSNSKLRIDTVYLPNGTKLKAEPGGWYHIPDGLTNIGIYYTDTNTSGWGGHWAGFKWIEMEGKFGSTSANCTQPRVFEATFAKSAPIFSDSNSATGIRSFWFEDLSEPEDICSEEHIHPSFEVVGSNEGGGLAGLSVEWEAYWGGLFGDHGKMDLRDNLYASKQIEIGLKQSYEGKAAWVGMQVVVRFPSRGSVATDLAYMWKKVKFAKIRLDYKLWTK